MVSKQIRILKAILIFKKINLICHRILIKMIALTQKNWQKIIILNSKTKNLEMEMQETIWTF